MSTRFAAKAFVLWFLFIGLATKTAVPATASASFGVTTIVQASCQASPTRATFRTYAAALANATSSVSVTCTNPTPYDVTLGTDSTVAAVIAAFKLIGSGSAVSSLALQSNVRKSFTWKPQSNAVAPTPMLALQAVNRPYVIDGASAIPGVVTVIITY